MNCCEKESHPGPIVLGSRYRWVFNRELFINKRQNIFICLWCGSSWANANPTKSNMGGGVGEGRHILFSKLLLYKLDKEMHLTWRVVTYFIGITSLERDFHGHILSFQCVINQNACRTPRVNCFFVWLVGLVENSNHFSSKKLKKLQSKGVPKVLSVFEKYSEL